MQPASRQTHTLPVLLIVMLLIAQALATDSQPANPSPLRLLAYMQVFRLKFHFLVTTSPIDKKSSKCFCTWSVRVCVPNFTVIRRDISEEIGHRQNKQTCKYLVDDAVSLRDDVLCKLQLILISGHDCLNISICQQPISAR